MLLRIRLKHLLMAFVLLLLSFLLIYEKAIRDNFTEKNREIVKSVTRGILDTDDLMGDSLEAKLKSWIAIEKLTPSKTTEDFIKIRDELNVTILTTWNKEGKMVLNSNGEASKTPSYALFEFCPQYRNMQQESGVIRTFPVFKSKKRNVPNKLSIVYNAELGKYFNISYDEAPIRNILNDKARLHSDISYMGLSGPAGIEIMAYNKNNMTINPIVFEDYQEKITIERSKDFETITIPFGGLQKEFCLQNNRGAAEDGKYFYVLTAVFSKADINHKMFVIRSVLLTIIGVLSVAAYILSMASEKRKT